MASPSQVNALVGKLDENMLTTVGAKEFNFSVTPLFG